MNGKMFSSYIAKSHAGATLTDKELKAIRNGDEDSIIRAFCDMRNERYTLQLLCTIKCINSYMGDNIELHSISWKSEYRGNFIGCQIMDGDTDVFLGVAGDNDAMLSVASKFAMEEINQFDVDAYDALCEMINVMNGTFATRLSDDNVQVVLHPPVFYSNTSLKSDKGFYVITFTMKDKEFKMIMVADNKVNIIT